MLRVLKSSKYGVKKGDALNEASRRIRGCEYRIEDRGKI